jgi:hypothetical protein
MAIPQSPLPQGDEIVQRMAADLRLGGCPREQVAHDDGTPRHKFMGDANHAYAEFGGEDGGRLGAIPRAIIALAYERPARSFTLRAATEGFEPEQVLDAVTLVELGLRIRILVCDKLNLPPEQVRIELTSRYAIARAAGDQLLAKFAIHESE